jgi:hypothetical protein
MIEINGFYYKKAQNNKTIPVLVQFDGRLLHVWHLSDPFYRVRTSKEFRICSSKNEALKMIRFQDGACIETDNHEILDRLNASSQSSMPKRCCKTVFGRHGTLCIVILILFMISAIGFSVFTM